MDVCFILYSVAWLRVGIIDIEALRALAGIVWHADQKYLGPFAPDSNISKDNTHPRDTQD
jgi:hypothetical protein